MVCGHSASQLMFHLAMPITSRMVNPELGGGSLLDMGPYPSTWAMLVFHHSPARKSEPRVLFSHQTTYDRTGVDSNSRWLVEWEGLGQAFLLTDMMTPASRDQTVTVHCEEADVIVECKCRPYSHLFLADHWFRPSIPARDFSRRTPSK